jgi:hypothetical protein
MQSAAFLVFCLVVIPGAVLVAVRIASVYTPITVATTHSDAVTVVLAGLTVSIAVLAVSLGVFAIFGYAAIKTEAAKTAAKAARHSALKSVKNVDFQKQLRDEVRKTVADEFAKWKESYELSASQPPQTAFTIESGEQTGKVGKPIPKKPPKGAE